LYLLHDLARLAAGIVSFLHAAESPMEPVSSEALAFAGLKSASRNKQNIMRLFRDTFGRELFPKVVDEADSGGDFGNFDSIDKLYPL
jgi:hypothetical protein